MKPTLPGNLQQQVLNALQEDLSPSGELNPSDDLSSQHVLRLTMCKKELRKLLKSNSYESVEKTCSVVGELHTCYTRTTEVT